MPDLTMAKIDQRDGQSIKRLRHLGRVMMRTGAFRLNPELHWRFEFEHMGRVMELRDSRFGNETSLMINTLEWNAQILFRAVEQTVFLTTHDDHIITGHQDILETPLYTRVETCLHHVIRDVESMISLTNYGTLSETRVRLVMLLWFIEFGQVVSYALKGDRAAFDRDMLMLFMDDSYMNSVERLGAL